MAYKQLSDDELQFKLNELTKENLRREEEKRKLEEERQKRKDDALYDRLFYLTKKMRSKFGNESSSELLNIYSKYVWNINNNDLYVKIIVAEYELGIYITVSVF